MRACFSVYQHYVLVHVIMMMSIHVRPFVYELSLIYQLSILYDLGFLYVCFLFEIQIIELCDIKFKLNRYFWFTF